MSKRRRANRLKVAANVGLAALAIGTAAVVAIVVTTPHVQPPVSEKVEKYLANQPAAGIRTELPYMAIIGDSFASDGAKDWPKLTAECSKYRLSLSGVRSSGFFSEGLGVPYGDPSRLNPVLANKPEIVIFESAYNDAKQAIKDPASVEQAAVAAIEAARAQVPKAKFVIVGPFPPERFAGPDVTNNKAALEAAAKTTGATYLSALEWQPTDDLVKEDKAHPNAKGHLVITADLLIGLRDNGLITTTSGCEKVS